LRLVVQGRQTLGKAESLLPRLLLLTGALVSLLPLLALALYAFPSADDYCLAVEVRKGFWRMQWHSYLSWTGRYTATFLQAAPSQWDLASVYPWFCLATLLATIATIRASIATICRRAASSRQFTVTAAVGAAVFVGRLPSPTESFYWMASATTYSWGVIAYVVWLTLLIRITRDAGRPQPQVALRALAVSLTILLPGFNETLAPIFLMTMVGFVVVSRLQRLEADRFMMTLFCVAGLLTAASLLAPGNAARSSTYPDIATRHNIEFALAETARQTARFLGNFGSYPALWVAALAAWWWGPRNLTRTIVPRGRLLAGAAVLVPVAVVYITLFPLYWEYGEVNYTGEGRTYNITYFVLCATVVLATGSLLDVASERWPAVIARLRSRRATVDLVLASTLALLMVSSSGTLRAFDALSQAPAYLEAQQRRESILRAPGNRGKALVVNAMRIRPIGLFWGDVQPKETHWINSCVATYYGLGSVRTPPIN
jgi:Family of unknown function (DUF6056)